MSSQLEGVCFGHLIVVVHELGHLTLADGVVACRFCNVLSQLIIPVGCWTTRFPSSKFEGSCIFAEEPTSPSSEFYRVSSWKKPPQLGPRWRGCRRRRLFLFCPLGLRPYWLGPGCGSWLWWALWNKDLPT